MSDTREDANQELIEAGMAGGIEDSLAASLGSSFSPAPRSPTPSSSRSATAASAPATDAPTEPERKIPGMDEWKSTLDAYNTQWLAESSEARAKAEATRTRIEEERASSSKSSADAAKAKRAADKAREEELKRSERLREELSGSPGLRRSKGRHLNLGAQEDREKKVKEAWEMVKGSSSAPAISSGVVHPGDARGVMPQDIAAGQASAPGQSRSNVKSTAYDPTTSREPLPPSMQSSASAPDFPMPSESQTLSRHSATSQAWEEISPPSSSDADLSPSSGELLNVPHSSNRLGQSLTDPVPRGISAAGLSAPDLGSTGETPRPGQHNTPPSQPPSLTLSLFTMPSHLSFSRVVAVLGINLLLPFINGVMLGFGEIFAREVFRVGRLVFRGERSWFGEPRRGDGSDNKFAGGRGVAGVGLSGSGGFP